METPGSLDREDKTRYEQAWVDYLMGQSIDWHLFRSTHKMYLYEGKVLVVWKHVNGQPCVKGLLRVRSVDLSFTVGLRLELQDTKTGYAFWIDAQPKEALPGIFLWTPAFCDVRFTPMRYDLPDSTRRLTIPMCCKTRSRSDRPQEGHSYILPLKEFSQLWPNVTTI